MIAVAYGGGRDSTAMLIEAYKRGIRPDLIMFADTGSEMPHTYELVRTFSAWLVERGFPEITIVRKTRRNGEVLSLYDHCVNQQMLPSLAYGFKSCSVKFKREPQDKFCNNHPPCKAEWKAGRKVEKWIGYESGEERRAKNTEDKKYRYRYPLIEWGMNREACLRTIVEAGIPPARKSSCFFCPSTTKRELLALKSEYPDLLKRAIHMEDLARPNLETVLGLGRRFSWRQFLEGDPNATLFADYCSLEVACGCYDGD